MHLNHPNKINTKGYYTNVNADYSSPSRYKTIDLIQTSLESALNDD